MKRLVLDPLQLELALARRCMSVADLSKKSGLGLTVIYRAMSCGNVSTVTLGRIACALEVDPSELLTKEVQ